MCSKKDINTILEQLQRCNDHEEKRRILKQSDTCSTCTKIQHDKGVEKYLAIRDFQFPKMPKMAFSRFSRRCCLMSVTCQVVFLGFLLSQEKPLMFYW